MEIIILGDFIDIIRSTRWTEDIQPWSKDSDEKKDIVTDIIREVMKKNKPVFDRLNDYTKKKVKITYIIGNHDRLINSEGYENIRERIGALVYEDANNFSHGTE